jgi:type IV pilus assembly protein PilC
LTNLRNITSRLENKKLKEVIDSVARDVEAGSSFSQALAKHPAVFPRLFVNMSRVGEASGKLASVLSRYSAYMEYQLDLQQKISGALFYPLLLLCAGVAVTLFIVSTIIPQFAQIFIKAGIRLPLPTLVVYKTGLGIRNFWYLGLILFIGLGLWLKFYIATSSGRLRFDWLKLNLPLIGPLYRKVAISRFCRSLATLVQSGVPILEALEITREVIGNEVLGRAISNTRSAVERGEKIGESLKVSEEFPPDVLQMISAGEETGELATLLNKVADFYELSLGYAIKKLTTIIEPVFLVFMGGMVGLIMASMLLPIFDMMQVLRR